MQLIQTRFNYLFKTTKGLISWSRLPTQHQFAGRMIAYSVAFGVLEVSGLIIFLFPSLLAAKGTLKPGFALG